MQFFESRKWTAFLNESFTALWLENMEEGKESIPGKKSANIAKVGVFGLVSLHALVCVVNNHPNLAECLQISYAGQWTWTWLPTAEQPFNEKRFI